MAIEVIAEDGGQRQHRQSLQKLLEATTGSLRIASAYVTDRQLLLGRKNRKVQLLTSLMRMDIISGATSLAALRSLIEAGVHCRCLSDGPRLHAKVYIFGGDSAVVTSANLTNSALDSNIEVGVRITGSAVQDLSAWFDASWAKADRVGTAEIAEWEQETEALRKEYAALRKKARAKPTFPSEVNPSVPLPSGFRDLMDNASGFFVCNTNRRHSPDGEDEELMRRTCYAAVWTEFRYPSHMERVEPGHVILMFAKGIGIVGVGRANGKCEILPPGDPGRISKDYRHDEEWRIPVNDWLAWAENAEDAFSWQMPNASFLDVSPDAYHEMREDVRKHFLREP